MLFLSLPRRVKERIELCCRVDSAGDMAGNDAGVQDSADKSVSEFSLCLALNSAAVSPQRYRLGVNRV